MFLTSAINNQRGGQAENHVEGTPGLEVNVESVKAKISSCPDCVPDSTVEPEEAGEVQVSVLQLCTLLPPALLPCLCNQGPLGQWLCCHEVGGKEE